MLLGLYKIEMLILVLELLLLLSFLDLKLIYVFVSSADILATVGVGSS